MTYSYKEIKLLSCLVTEKMRVSRYEYTEENVENINSGLHFPIILVSNNMIKVARVVNFKLAFTE